MVYCEIPQLRDSSWFTQQTHFPLANKFTHIRLRNANSGAGQKIHLINAVVTLLIIEKCKYQSQHRLNHE